MGMAVWNLRCTKCGNIMVWFKRDLDYEYYICLGCSAEFVAERSGGDDLVDEVIDELKHMELPRR